MRAIGNALLTSPVSNLCYLECDVFTMCEGMMELQLRQQLLGPAATVLFAGVLKHNTLVVYTSDHGAMLLFRPRVKRIRLTAAWRSMRTKQNKNETRLA